jgi:hypothetical protein
VAKSKSTNVLKLTLDEQASWLGQHIPNRVSAAWVWLRELHGEWEWKGQERDDFDKNADPNHVWCIGRSVDHGRKTAMRWLIEFVGISLNSDEKPVRPTRRDKEVSIQSFVADRSDLQIPLDRDNPSSKAWILARVWKGCTQSSLHSTFKTSHPREDPQALAEAFTIIVEHLQAKLYDSRGGKRLNQIVREQH